jgi:hypothetical protein
MKKQKQKGGSSEQIIYFSSFLFIVLSIVLTILAYFNYKLFVVILIIFSGLSLLSYSIMQLPKVYNSNDNPYSYGLTIQYLMLSLISVMLFVLASKYKNYTILFPITFILLILSVSFIIFFGTKNDGIMVGIIFMIFASVVSLVILIVQQTYILSKGGIKNQKIKKKKK